MNFWKGAIISITSCSNGSHDLFPPKFDEIKKRAINIRRAHIQNVLIRLIDSNYSISPKEKLLFDHNLSEQGNIIQCLSGTKNNR